MVCSTAILSSSLALSLLRHSSSPTESFVFSPYSLNTALSIVHDGASGKTQEELTNLLLNGCSPSDVTDFYSSLVRSISSRNNTAVSFKSANRFYVDHSISLKNDYQTRVEDKYKVENMNFGENRQAASAMNSFIEEATNGMIKYMINADSIDSDTKAILINAIHFLGKWKMPFDPKHSHNRTFYGSKGDREIAFMSAWTHFQVNFVRNFASALVLPYKDESYSFFYLLPCDSRQSHCESNLTLEEMRNELTGEKLLKILREAKKTDLVVTIPKFKVEAELDGKKVLEKMGVNQLFTQGAELSKISETALRVSDIRHKAVIEVDEKGVEAAAVTTARVVPACATCGPPSLTVDRPFLFGILRHDTVIFLGQSVSEPQNSLPRRMGLSDYVVTCLLYCLILQVIAFHRTLYVEADSQYQTSCSTAILSSSVALSLLRHSSSLTESFVFSPYSLNTALSIVHDGTSGKTQKELTDLLLNGCSPSDVTEFYSSLAIPISSTSNITNETGVAFKSANRFYVDYSISLKNAYQKHVEDKYKVQAENIDLRQTENAAKTMNDFIDEATNGKIKDVIKPASIDPDANAILINAIHFLGKWKKPFHPKETRNQTFHGNEGDREMEFMHMSDDFLLNIVQGFASVLILPYKDDNYKFFYLLPHICPGSKRERMFGCESSRNLTLEEMRNELTGEMLLRILKEAKETDASINLPKFKLETEMDAKKVLSKMGVEQLFNDDADLSKISGTPLYVSDIHHKAVLEVDEQGVEAAAVTTVRAVNFCGICGPEYLTIDRPFMFGIMRGDDILFLGQYV